MHQSYQDILDFRFAPGMDELWYASDPKFDAGIRAQFMHTYEAASDGKLDAWREPAPSMLALIIVLDQFPRNMFRGEARAFASDRLALSLIKEGISKGFDRALDGAQLDFFYMPLMHSETLDDHLLLGERGRGYDRYAQEHRSIIERFGRFPQRNAALGRTNTPEEKGFLELVPTLGAGEGGNNRSWREGRATRLSPVPAS
jgi:uncharacterized protein (DUF924 family)